MPPVEATSAVRQLLSVLREAVEGQTGSWTYFIDKRPDAALLGALATLSADEASRVQGDTTVAAHVHHAAFALAASAAAIEGDPTPVDWKESWRVTSVDEVAWKELVARVDREYRRLRRAIESKASSSDEAFGEAVGSIAHVAYHLGAVRQKIVALRAADARSRQVMRSSRSEAQGRTRR
jgi:hypothetical protein